MSRRILITGASIAGNTVAWWLTRYGFDVTVVEKASAFREGGQNIDVRGAARDVVRKMGLEQAVLDHNTGERGIAWVDERNTVVAQFNVDDMGPDGPTAELEILRGDLARILYEPAATRATYRFGDSIAAVDQDESGASVVFTSGRTERFDIVIIAEGVGSATRDLLFKGENRPRWMDFALAYFTIPRGPTDSDIARWFNAPGGRGAWTRPDRNGTTRAMLTVQKPSDGEHTWGIDRQKAFLRDTFVDAGWETPRLLAGLETTKDFYFEALRQVKMDRWSNGRVVLTGDAAWCATTLSGSGTTLAIVGAYILAGEIAKTADVGAALAAYDRVMRPVVDKGQGAPKFVPRMMNPQTRTGIAILRGALRVIAKPVVRDNVAKLFRAGSKRFDLPVYRTIS